MLDLATPMSRHILDVHHLGHAGVQIHLTPARPPLSDERE
jgi:hypothetical protein